MTSGKSYIRIAKEKRERIDAMYKLLDKLGWFALGLLFAFLFVCWYEFGRDIEISVGRFDSDVVKMIYISYK